MLVRQALRCPCWEYSFTTTPGFSTCSRADSYRCSGTQRLQCGRQRSPSFLPHSALIVPLVSVERRTGGSWPSFLKCQAPWGQHVTSVLPGLPHCSWSHRQIGSQPVPVCDHHCFSGLPWDQMGRFQPPVSQEQSSQLPGAKFPEGRKDPYPSQVQECR